MSLYVVTKVYKDYTMERVRMTVRNLVPCPMCKGSLTIRMCYLCMSTGKTEEDRAYAYQDAHR